MPEVADQDLEQELSAIVGEDTPDINLLKHEREESVVTKNEANAPIDGSFLQPPKVMDM